MIAVHKISSSDVANYGIFAGTWDNDEETIMVLDRIKEKPTQEYAEDYLGVKSRHDNKKRYYAAFGSYILSPEIFDELDAMCARSNNNAEEVGFTEALEKVMKTSGMYAFVPDGESYDIGNAKAYRKTFLEFGKDVN